MEMNTSPSHPDATFESLLGSEVFQSTTTLRQLHHLLGCGEGESSRQSGFLGLPQGLGMSAECSSVRTTFKNRYTHVVLVLARKP
jgi:hypothetical protein